MSYYNLTNDYYQPPTPGTPGWQLAPVPGWGMNPARSGPARIAANGLSGVRLIGIGASEAPVVDSEAAGTEGKIAMAAAGGIFLGWALAWVYWSNRSNKKQR